jgi:hypothetical protein
VSGTKIPVGKTLGFGVLLWMVGFAWGSIVFMTPALKAIPSVPHLSQYPAISAPLFVVFPLLAFYFTRLCVEKAEPKEAAGLQVGIVFATTNFLLDLLVLVLAFKAGFGFFSYASIWVAYALLVAVPWAAGRKLAARPAA